MNAHQSTDPDTSGINKDECIQRLISEANERFGDYSTNLIDANELEVSLNLLREAVKLGSPQAMYYLARKYFNYAEHFISPDSFKREAVELYEAAYKAGERRAIIELKHIFTNIYPNPKKAYYYFKQDANDGNSVSQYEVAMRKIEGKGTSQDYKGAFFYLWKAAAGYHYDLYGYEEDFYKAQFQLAKFYISGLLFPNDFVCALFWALMSQNITYYESNCAFINDIMKNMEKSDIIECQAEVKKYTDQLELVAQGHSALIITPAEYYDKHGYKKTSPKVEVEPSLDGLANLGTWKVKEAKQLAITLNYNDKVKTAVFRYQGKQLTIPISKAFSSTYQAILVKHYNYIKGENSQISYHGHDLCKDGKNANHYYVDHFNSHLRKLVGADSAFKPFTWIGTRGSKNKGLKAHIQINVFI